MQQPQRPKRKITRRQETAIIALLTESSTDRAAQAAGINRTTLWRWLTGDEAFQRGYAAARRRKMARAVDKLGDSAGLAVATLRNIMRSSQAPAAARVAAARTTLDSLTAVSLSEIEERLAAVENTRGRR